MARKPVDDNQEPLEEGPREPAGEAARESTAEELERLTDAEAQDAGDEMERTAPPSEHDLHEQGFTQDEVQRLVVISDRAAHSTESRAAEAQLRRLRFTRWLIEHGMLDEWSA